MMSRERSIIIPDKLFINTGKTSAKCRKIALFCREIPAQGPADFIINYEEDCDFSRRYIYEFAASVILGWLADGFSVEILADCREEKMDIINVVFIILRNKYSLSRQELRSFLLKIPHFADTPLMDSDLCPQ